MMNNTTENSSRTASIVRTLCNAEERDVVLRFGGPISIPIGKYDGHSYQSDTLPKATLNATIQYAEVEQLEGVLLCFAGIEMEELERVGIDHAVVYTEPIDGHPEHCVVDVRASREWVNEESEISMEEAELAVKESCEEEILPPWDDRPTVVVKVKRTEECLERSYESDCHIQYDPPTHEMGELIDVRIK